MKAVSIICAVNWIIAADVVARRDFSLANAFAWVFDVSIALLFLRCAFMKQNVKVDEDMNI